MRPPPWALLFAWSALAPVAVASPGHQDADEAVATAALEQRVLPDLIGRRLAAEARIDAAERFFRGEVSLSGAWPRLDSAPIGDEGWRRGERERLRRAAISRAAERVSPPSAALPVEGIRALRAAQAQATEAEARADALEERLLDSIDAGLSRAPGLAEPSYGRRIDALDKAARLREGADDAEAARAATAADQATALRSWRAAAFGAMTRPDAPDLQSMVDRGLAEAPPLDGPLDEAARDRARDLQDRLMRVMPLLQAAGPAAAWVAAADAVLFPPVAPDEAPPEAAPPRAVATLEGQLAAARAEARALSLALAPEAADPAQTPGARRDMEQRSVAAEAAIRALTAELELSRALAASGLDGSGVGRSVDEADRLAEAARAQVEGAEANEAAIRTQTAELRELAASEVRAETDRRSAALSEIAATRTAIDEARSALRAADGLATLDPDRQPSLDRAYLQLRALAADLSARAEALEAQRAADPAEVEVLPLPPGADPTAAAELRAAEADLAAERAAARALQLEEQDAVVGLLVEAKGARRRARSLASPEAQLIGQRAFIPELGRELHETWLILQARARAAYRSVRGLPSQLTDLTALLALLTGSIEGLLGLVLWAATRRGAPGWVSTSAARLQATHGRGDDRWSRAARFLRDRLEPGDLRGLVPEVTTIVRAGIDLIAATTLALTAGATAAPVRLFAVGMGSLAAWRTAGPLTKTLLSTSGEERPAVWSVRPETRARALSGLRYLLAWRLGVRLLDVILVDILAADRAAQLVGALSFGVGAALSVALLWMWADSLQRACAAAEPSAAMRWAATPVAGLRRLPRAAVGLTLLSWQAAWGAASDLLAAQTSLRWIGAALARRRYARSGAVSPPPAPELAARIDALRLPPPPNLLPALKALQLDADGLDAPLRPGVYAVVGDRGSGLDALPAAIAAAAPDAQVLRPPQRIREAEAALTWIAEAVGAPSPQPAALQAHLRARGGALLLLDLHLLLLRTVGGFDAMRAILELLQATGDRCTWICAVPAPTWSYLQGAPQAVDLSIFRRSAEVEPMSAEALGRWLMTGLQSADLRPRFGALAADGERSDDARAEQRARAGYLRLLEDLSQGHPLVAERLWRSSHRAGSAPDEVEHSAPALPSVGMLSSLGDEDLFLLTALAVHGGLTVPELAEALNRPSGAIQAACRRLTAARITERITGADGGYAIDRLALPQALRLLRNRAFLHRS